MEQEPLKQLLQHTSLKDSTQVLLQTNGYAIFKEKLFDSEQSKIYFDYLKNLPFQETYYWIDGKRVKGPRKMIWFADESKNEYSFSTNHEALKVNLIKNEDNIEKLRVIASEISGVNMNSCLVNIYENGNEHAAWHSDDDPWYGPNPTIVSFSFGAVRPFKIRPKSEKSNEMTVDLQSGSLLIMGGEMQDYWQHSLPIVDKFDCGVRINLTFRYIHPDYAHLKPIKATWAS